MDRAAIDDWDAQAATFDEAPDHGLRQASIHAAWQMLLGSLIPSAPRRVLDLGCGTGSLAHLLATQGYAVTGVDFSTQMVAHARAKRRDGATGPVFVVGDAAAPPVAGGFDVVLARHVVWALPDPSTALQRWVELVRPGGLLVLIEGRWHTAAGLPAATLTALVQPLAVDVVVRSLPDRALWGADITDERYALTAHAPLR